MSCPTFIQNYGNIILLLDGFLFFYKCFRIDEVGFLGFGLAMTYFESFELYEWFSAVKYVPPIFVTMLCYFDKALTKSLGLVHNSAKPKNRYCYNYLIVDAKKFVSLMRRRSGLSLNKHSPTWHDYWLFRSCIVYVGKGTNARRDMHLKEAKLVYIGELDPQMASTQAVYIATCWENGGGIFSIQFESEATSPESLCREAAIIEAVGLINLENKILGSRYGEMKTWSNVKVRNFGEILLFIVFKSFILKRPPVIMPCDVTIHVGSMRCKAVDTCKNCGHVIK